MSRLVSAWMAAGLAMAALAGAGARAEPDETGDARPQLAADPRIVTVPYHADRVVPLSGHVKVQTVIEFGADEVIENVAIGDSASWQVTPNKSANRLFVKPLSPRAQTNLTVVTSKRTYLFDLAASPRAKPVYALRFRYPQSESAPPADEPQLASATELEAARDPYAVFDPATLNFNWEVRGARALAPERVYDDGAATYLSFAERGEVPAILVSDAKGTEGPVNFTVRGERIVIDGVPREIVLRSGKRKAVLINRRPPARAGSGSSEEKR